jgi:hypothetical protein
VFHQVARAPDTFPYPELLLSSKGLAVPIEACADISPFMPLLWPEVDELQAGDDDDAVDDDDVGDDDSVDDDDSADAGDDDDDSGG